MDKIAARFLVFQFYADTCRFKSRLRAQKADDRIAQPDEGRLTIGAHKRSQCQAENDIGAPTERHARIRFTAWAGRVIKLCGPLDQPGRFRVEHELPAGMMRKPRAQPVTMFLNKRKRLACRATRRKQGLAQEGAYGAYGALIVVCSAASRSRRRRETFANDAVERSGAATSWVDISSLLQ